LIDLAARVGGTFFLPYQLHYSAAQLERAYPGVREFFATKRQLDPSGLLTNTFYETYAAMVVGGPEMAPHTPQGGSEAPRGPGALLDLRSTNQLPGGVGERSRATAALLRVGVVRGAGDDAAHDALGDRGQPEHREGQTELPVGDRGAPGPPAVRRDVVRLARDTQRGEVLVGQPFPTRA